MKKMKKVFLLVVLISFSSHAQLGGLIKKTKDKAEKKVEEKIEDKTNTGSSNGTTTSSGTQTTTTSTTSGTSSTNSKQKPIEVDKSEGITSPTHQKYLNKIVFASSDKSIAKKAEIEADFKSEFNLGDPIYFRFYLSKTIEQSLAHIDDGSSDFESGMNLEFKFYINDVLVDNVNGKFEYGDINSEIREKWTTLRGAFKSVDKSKYIGKYQFEELLRLNGEKFKIGKNKLKVEIYPISHSNYGKGDVVASSEITLNVKNSLINPNDPDICMPQAKMKDDVLLKNIIKNHSEEKTGFKVDPKNIRITSPSWNVNKNYKGIPLNRTISVSAGYKDGTNNKCYKAFYTVEQEYVGSKFENETYLLTNNIVEKEEINCGCLK
jgi:hypothetical protein